MLCAAAGAGLGFAQPLSMTIVVQLVHEHARATALAIRLTGNRVGQVLRQRPRASWPEARAPDPSSGC